MLGYQRPPTFSVAIRIGLPLLSRTASAMSTVLVLLAAGVPLGNSVFTNSLVKGILLASALRLTVPAVSWVICTWSLTVTVASNARFLIDVLTAVTFVGSASGRKTPMRLSSLMSLSNGVAIA